jgi:HEAT repeat protein
MGLLDVFDKEKRRKAAIERNVRKLQQKYGQSDSRSRAVVALREDGSEEAIYGLLQRYKVNVDPSITDQEEKEWVREVVAEFGEKALAPLTRFIHKQSEVMWPLRIFGDIQGIDAAVGLACDVLRKSAVEYQRDNTKKITLLKYVVSLEAKRPEVVEAIEGLLEDMDGDTVIAAVSALSELDTEGRSREKILEALREKGPSNVRLKLEIFRILAETGWAVKGYRPTVEELIDEPYYLTGDGVVKVRAK